jgi:hypothetical protein
MASPSDKYELPEILYDEPQPGRPANPFPFINVKKDSKVPVVLFIEVRQDTGETEPGPDGRPQEIVDCLMHKYVDLEHLKEKLPPHMNDIVRVALGMKPLAEARSAGQIILDKAKANAEKYKEETLSQQNNKSKTKKKDKKPQ